MIEDDSDNSDSEPASPLPSMARGRQHSEEDADDDKENTSSRQNQNMSSPVENPSCSDLGYGGTSTDQQTRSTGCQFSSPPQPLAITPISKISRISDKNVSWDSTSAPFTNLLTSDLFNNALFYILSPNGRPAPSRPR